jgi:hypothetical protein
MHCPRCGQKQASVEAHFCKSCGFPLDRVKELLAGDGVPPALEKESPRPGESPRRRGVRHGVILFFVCLALAAFTTRGSGGRGDFLPIIFFLAALMRTLYAVLFQEGAPRKKKREGAPARAPISTKQWGTATLASALPPPLGVPIPAFNTRRVNLAQTAGPPSVTEHTTRLLNETPGSK